MHLDVVSLWHSDKEDLWQAALALYWQHPSVLNNLEVERYIDELLPSDVREFDSESWRRFLNVYFQWKFKGNYLPRRLRDLEAISSDQLLRIRDLILATDPQDTLRAIERAGYVKGLAAAGASGLLAVLFPDSFGTVDRFVVEALLRVEDLPERPKLLRMDPKNLTDRDAVVLIDILRDKAAELNSLFHTREWTPRKIDMVLWSLRDNANPCGRR